TRSYGDWSSDVCSSDLTPQSQLIGLWDEGAQKITFFRVLDPASPVTQVYTGLLFNNSRDRPPNLTYTLTGFFEALEGVPAHRTKIGRASCRERVWKGEG